MRDIQKTAARETSYIWTHFLEFFFPFPYYYPFLAKFLLVSLIIFLKGYVDLVNYTHVRVCAYMVSKNEKSLIYDVSAEWLEQKTRVLKFNKSVEKMKTVHCTYPNRYLLCSLTETPSPTDLGSFVMFVCTKDYL